MGESVTLSQGQGWNGVPCSARHLSLVGREVVTCSRPSAW